MTVKFDVLRDGKERFLIVSLDNATMTTQTIDCSIYEALELMWKIHRECGGNGSLTRD